MMSFTYNAGIICIIFSSLTLIQLILCQPMIDLNKLKINSIQKNLNDSELKLLLRKTFTRYPLNVLFGHAIMESMAKSNSDPYFKDSTLSVRDRRYQSPSTLNDQSFLRFGRNNKQTRKRPNDGFDLNDTSFLRFGRNGSQQ